MLDRPAGSFIDDGKGNLKRNIESPDTIQPAVIEKIKEEDANVKREAVNTRKS